MIKNYLKIALRNIYKNKVYSLLNITGLAIGVMAFIMIMLNVRYELSFDKFSSNSEQIYRVATRGALGGNEFNMAVSPAPVGAEATPLLGASISAAAPSAQGVQVTAPVAVVTISAGVLPGRRTTL